MDSHWDDYSFEEPNLYLEGEDDYELEAEIEAEEEYMELDDLEEDDSDGETAYPYEGESWIPPPILNPQPTGIELLKGGEFGRLKIFSAIQNGRYRLHDILEQRRMCTRRIYKEDIARPLVPNSRGTIVAQYTSDAYAGQYSADSSFYYTCCQDFNLYVYDTTSLGSKGPGPRRVRGRRGLQSDHETSMNVIKTIRGVPGNWTITDSHLSPDNERIIYASISPTVYMTKTKHLDDEQIPIDFAENLSNYSERFGIWSCRFSADGNEIVAGGRKHIFVYDLLAMRRTVKIVAHRDDVNSCCWADSASGNVLISASDDSFLKVWDRRSLGSTAKPAGVLVGHTEGITYVSPKGDGRYVISNGKDQTLRLWDLRRMMSSVDFDALPNRKYGIKEFDYRENLYEKPRYSAHPQDNSVMQYVGHRVLHTLIRCHFSPIETTGGSYIYSGSGDGNIHVSVLPVPPPLHADTALGNCFTQIWSLDGRVVQAINRADALPIFSDPSHEEGWPLSKSGRSNCVVRDVSWHSQEPVLMSCAWSSAGSSSVARHEWKGLGKNAITLEDVVERDATDAADGV